MKDENYIFEIWKFIAILLKNKVFWDVAVCPVVPDGSTDGIAFTLRSTIFEKVLLGPKWEDSIAFRQKGGYLTNNMT